MIDPHMDFDSIRLDFYRFDYYSQPPLFLYLKVVGKQMNVWMGYHTCKCAFLYFIKLRHKTKQKQILSCHCRHYSNPTLSSMLI